MRPDKLHKRFHYEPSRNYHKWDLYHSFSFTPRTTIEYSGAIRPTKETAAAFQNAWPDLEFFMAFLAGHQDRSDWPECLSDPATTRAPGGTIDALATTVGSEF